MAVAARPRRGSIYDHRLPVGTDGGCMAFGAGNPAVARGEGEVGVAVVVEARRRFESSEPVASLARSPVGATRELCSVWSDVTVRATLVLRLEAQRPAIAIHSQQMDGR